MENEIWQKYGFEKMDFDKLIRMLQGFAGSNLGSAVAEQKFGDSLRPGYQQNIAQLLNALSSGGIDAARNREIGQVTQNAANYGNSAKMALGRAGVTSPGAVAGVGLDALGKKFEGTQAVNSKYLDPSYQANMLQQKAGVYQNAQSFNPALARLLQLIQATGGNQPKPEEGNDLFGSILGLGGSLASGGAFNGLF